MSDVAWLANKLLSYTENVATLGSPQQCPLQYVPADAPDTPNSELSETIRP